MGVFRDSKQFYETVGELMDRAKKDPQVGPKIAASGIIIQFRYTDPEAMTTVDAKDKPTQPGAFADVIHGPCDLKPDITLAMKADIAHAFWQGKVNLLGAIAETRHRGAGFSAEGPQTAARGRASLQGVSRPVAREGAGSPGDEIGPLDSVKGGRT